VGGPGEAIDERSGKKSAQTQKNGNVWGNAEKLRKRSKTVGKHGNKGRGGIP